MMKFRTLFAFFLSITAAALFQSCNDDDDDPSGPTPIAYPHTVTFSHIDNIEFKMWTNGAEVNTENLSIEDYMDPEDFDQLRPDYYATDPGITFTEDSLFSDGPNGIEGYTYFIQNDSIFVNLTVVYDGDTIQSSQYIAIGNTLELQLNEGYSNYCKTTDNFITTCQGYMKQKYLDFNSAAGLDGRFSEISDIAANDTMFIYNQRVVYN